MSSKDEIVLRIETCRDFGKLRDMVDELEDLFEACDDVSLYHNPRFWMSWWEGFRGLRLLAVFLARAFSGQLVGAAPMIVSDTRYRGVPVRVLGFMENGYVPSSGWMLHRSFADVALRHLVEAVLSFESWDVVHLAKLPVSSPVLDAVVHRARRLGRRYGGLPSIETPVVPISDSWDDYLRRRSTSFRKHLKKNRNRFNKAEGTSIDRVPATADNARALVETMSRISRASWKRREGTDLARDDAAKRFIEHLLVRFGERQSAEVWFAYKGTKPVAYELHLRQRETTFPLRADFDEAFRDLSPGAVLEAEILHRLFDSRDVHTYYSCGTSYRYLMRWTDRTQPHEDVDVFSDALSSKLAYYLEYRLMPVTRKVRGWLNRRGAGESGAP
jgi:hypothetical protein